MMAAPEKDDSVNLHSFFDPIKDEQGNIHYALREESAEILGLIIQEHRWWQGARKRASKLGFMIGGAIGVLSMLAAAWPWLGPIFIGIAKWFLSLEGEIT